MRDPRVARIPRLYVWELIWRATLEGRELVEVPADMRISAATREQLDFGGYKLTGCVITMPKK